MLHKTALDMRGDAPVYAVLQLIDQTRVLDHLVERGEVQDYLRPEPLHHQYVLVLVLQKQPIPMLLSVLAVY